MKKTSLIFGLTLLVTAWTSGAFSGNASVEQGAKLFNDPSLGGSANKTSCSSCHPDGRGLEGAGGKSNLTRMINMCIKNPLKGQELGEQSTEMESLKLYIMSLEK